MNAKDSMNPSDGQPGGLSATGLVAWLVEELARQFAGVVSTMTGAGAVAAPGKAVAPEPGDAEADRITWVQAFDLEPRTAVVVAAPPETWRLIGAQPLAAAGLTPEEIDDESARSTFLEMLQQTMGSLGTELSGRLARQVLPVDGQSAAVWPEDFTAVSYTLALAGGEPLVFYLGTSPGWEAALQPDAAGAAAAAAAGAGTGTAVGGDARAILAQNSRTFDLLLDVELPVSVSFGRAMIPLREVVKLTSGSVVELNRTVSEPVELIVNNCVIARGEVVVIEGNYGVRIQQIISPQERLRTLH